MRDQREQERERREREDRNKECPFARQLSTSLKPSTLHSSKFYFSQTVGEMVFVSFEVEKMRMFLVQSVAWYCVLVRRRGVQ